MHLFPLFCIVFCVICSGINAQPAATLLKDLNTSLSSFDEGSQPAELTILDNRLYFTARSSSSGFALFSTDGSPAGTALVRELYNLYPPSEIRPKELTVFDGKLYFASKTNDYVSSELWVSDGTAAGTQILVDNGPFTPRYLHVLNGVLLFMAGDNGNQTLWRTDGTPTGTTAVKDFGPNPYQSDDEPDAYCVAGNLMYFEMLGGQLWRTDGTTDGTQLITDFAPAGNDYADLDGMVEFAGNLYFLVQTVQDRVELWKSDGLTASHVKTLVDSGASSGPFYVSTAVTGNRFALALSDFSIFNYSLWISDGTEAGTHELTDETVSAEPWQNRPRLVGQNNYLYFASGNQLRRTDGTPAGTEAVFTAPGGNEPVWNLMVHNGALYFTVGENSPAINLWKTAGNPGGAIDLGSLNGYTFGPRNDWASFGGSLFFCSDNPYSNSEIWVSNGTNGAPHILTELSLPIGSSDPLGYRDAGGRCYFQARPGDKPHHLWRTDGDAVSTVLLDSLHSAYEYQATAPDGAVYTDLNVFWHTNGQPGSSETFLLPDGAQPLSSGNPKILASLSNGVWLAKGFPPGTYQALMTLDPATHTATVILGNEFPPDPIQFYGELDDRMLFTAPDPAQGGIYLWSTDGTAQGTQNIVWRSWSLNSSEPFAAAINGKLVFGASDGAWVTDGTAAGTQPLVTITTGGYASLYYFTPFDGALYFVMTELVNGKPKDRLWRTDGTPQGTHAVLDIASPIQGINTLVATDGFLFFNAKDEQHGWELWRSDGTENGTNLVTDLWPGIHSSWPSPVMGYQQYLFFMGYQAETGNELWITDGTGAGTRLVQDICPGPCSSWPFLGGLSAGRFLFSACHPDYGREPWILDPAVVSSGESDGSGLLTLDAWLSPNPAVATTTLFLRSDQRAHVEMQLFDALGRVAASWRHTILSGQQSLDLPLSGLPAGLYALHLDAGVAGSRVLRLVIQPAK